MPIGSERVTKDGYLQRKVTDTGYTPKDWVAVSHIEWEKHSGRKVPKGHAVIFRDSNNRNFAPANLELISRADLMRPSVALSVSVYILPSASRSSESHGLPLLAR